MRSIEQDIEMLRGVLGKYPAEGGDGSPRERESAWIDYDDSVHADSAVMRYDFENYEELKELLSQPESSKTWREWARLFAAAVMRQKNRSGQKIGDEQISIPAFIYNF